MFQNKGHWQFMGWDGVIYKLPSTANAQIYIFGTNFYKIQLLKKGVEL